MSKFSASNNLTALYKEMIEYQINVNMLNTATKHKHFNDNAFSFKLKENCFLILNDLSKQGT